MEKKRRGIWMALVPLLLVAFVALPYYLPRPPMTSAAVAPGTMEMHVIDVGQGDALLIRTEEYAVLVDCGTNESEVALHNYMSHLSVTTVDYLILTHPHEDHMGGADMVLREYEVGTVLLPDVTPEEDVGAQLAEAYAAGDAVVSTAMAGDVFCLGDLVISVLSPSGELYEQMNDNSLVLRVAYGDTVALLMGDAEEEVEQYLLATYDAQALDCDLLKAGHHGSQTSSSEELLDALTPTYVAISCGKGNSYGHPMQQVLDRIAAVGARACRTDREGSFVFVSDGETFAFQTK
jgi:competence protein ComEC